MSRSFLRQKVFEVAESLPDSKRKSALALMVRKWSPYASTGFAAHWVGHRASVYAWDAAKAQAAIAAAGLPASRCTIWPETFMREPVSEGTRLAVMTDGVEGQVWRQGLLIASRWWPSAPPPRDWIAFLRSGGADLTQDPLPQPVPVNLPILDTPWTVASAPITDFWSLIQNDRAAAVAAAVLAIPFIYLMGEISVLGVANAHISSAMADLSDANQAMRMDRSAAVADLDAIQRYLSLEPFPPQFQVMATAARLMKDRGLVISDWTYDSGNLEFVVHGDSQLDATFYIETFEKDPTFSNVTATTENQERDLRLKMQVNPKAQAS